MDWDLSGVHDFKNGILNFEVQCDVDDSYRATVKSKYKVGDVLYVRETWQKLESDIAADLNDNEYAYVFRASENGQNWAINTKDWTWRPSLHMPKEAARIFLKVTGVRVERLHEITPEQADKEGVGNLFMTEIACSDIDDGYGAEIDEEYGLAREQFAYLWDSTVNKSDLDRYGWNASPWVWVIEFERCKKEVE